MSFEMFLKETHGSVCVLPVKTHYCNSAACWSSHEVPCRFIQTYYVYRKTLTSLWYNLSQGKLHSLVTLMPLLWSSDTGSISAAFLDSENWIALPEGSQMVSFFCFYLSLSLLLCLIMFIWIFGCWLMTSALIHAQSQHLDSVYISTVGMTDSSYQQGCN